MRLEHVPLLLGVLVALLGVGLLADAWLPDAASAPAERRRRARAERDRVGEGIVGGGVLAMAAALIGGDNWRFGTLAVLLGAALLVAGAVRNRRYLRELLAFRGPARRRVDGAVEEPAAGEPGRGEARTR